MVSANERAIRLAAAEEREKRLGMDKKELERQRKRRQMDDPNMRLIYEKMKEEEERFDPVYHSSLK